MSLRPRADTCSMPGDDQRRPFRRSRRDPCRGPYPGAAAPAPFARAAGSVGATLRVAALVVAPALAATPVAPARAADCETRVEALPTGTDRLPIRDAARPALGAAAVDASHGTCVVRMTDHAASGTGRFARTIYSRSQAFNADGSRLLVYGQDGRWRTVDVRTSADLGIVPGIVGAASEPQWHASDPDLLYYLDEGGGDRLRRVNVASGELRVVADFRGRLGRPDAVRASTGSSGAPSADQRRWAFAVEDAGGTALGIVVWDARSDRIVARLDFAAAGLPPTDTVSMSPSGRHVVAEWGAPTGTRVWEADLAGPGIVVNATAEHGDTARLANGRDAWVSVDFRSGRAFFVDLDATVDAGRSARTDLFGIYPERTIHSIHFSGRALDRPGWALASTYDPRRTDPSRAATWLDRHVFAVELVPGGRTVGIAHSRVRALRPDEDKIYFAEPHATASRDFSAVAWNSNWGAGDALDVDAYAVLDLDWRGLDGDGDGGDGSGEGGSGECDARAADARRAVAPNAWALLGLPCAAPAGATLADVFGDDVDGAIGTGWALYTFDPATNAYAAGRADSPAPAPGEGFWFIHANDGERVLDLPAGSVPARRTADGARCPSPAGCVDVALAIDGPSGRYGLVANPVAATLGAPDVRVAADVGACRDGCDTAGAVAAGVLDELPVRYREGAGGRAGGYEPIGATGVPPWSGLWARTGSAGDGAALVFVPPGGAGR